MSLSNLKGGRVGEKEAHYHEILNCGVVESLETDALHFCTMRSWRAKGPEGLARLIKAQEKARFGDKLARTLQKPYIK